MHLVLLLLIYVDDLLLSFCACLLFSSIVEQHICCFCLEHHSWNNTPPNYWWSPWVGCILVIDPNRRHTNCPCHGRCVLTRTRGMIDTYFFYHVSHLRNNQPPHHRRFVVPRTEWILVLEPNRRLTHHLYHGLYVLPRTEYVTEAHLVFLYVTRP